MEVKKNPSLPILIVDDEQNSLVSFEVTLKSSGINNILLCQDSRQVMTILAEQRLQLIMLDLTMPNLSGVELLEMISQDYPDIPVIIVTGNSELDTAVKCMQCGAVDYMVKPVEESRLISGVKRVAELVELRLENTTLRQQLLYGKLNRPEIFKSIDSKDSVMLSIFKYIEVIAKSPEPILITGETGVGKELIAQAVHRISERKGKFICVNVAGVDDNVFSDTLFGHKRGAFTDAHQDRSGFLEQAASGTLFLDEIGDLSPVSQVKLLRLLQEHEYYPIGSDIPKYSDAHVVAATNKDLEKFQQTGQFRKDLFFRLNVHHVHIPPLRERLSDIPLIVDSLLTEVCQTLNKKKPTVPAELFTLLQNYAFPGNIRELRSMIFNAISAHQAGILSLKVFRDIINAKKTTSSQQKNEAPNNQLFLLNKPMPTLKQAETFLIQEALKQSKHNQSIAAQILGITRQTLNRKLKSYHQE